jgi:DNA-binding IclR family transcriptional regulator
VALLVPQPPAPDDREALAEARRLGWASSHGEVIPGLRSIAAPVLGPDGGARAAIAVVYVDDRADVDRVGRRVVEAATGVAAALR